MSVISECHFALFDWSHKTTKTTSTISIIFPLNFDIIFQDDSKVNFMRINIFKHIRLHIWKECSWEIPNKLFPDGFIKWTSFTVKLISVVSHLLLIYIPNTYILYVYTRTWIIQNARSRLRLALTGQKNSWAMCFLNFEALSYRSLSVFIIYIYEMLREAE